MTLNHLFQVSTMPTVSYLADPPRSIVSIAYDPPRVANLKNITTAGDGIDVMRGVQAETQKVLQCSLLFGNA